MPTGRIAPLAALALVLTLAACGSGGDASDGSNGSGGAGRTGRTHLVVEGVATRRGAPVTPDPGAPPPIPDPSDATDVPFAGTLDCTGTPKGTGIFGATATEVCATLNHRPETFDGSDDGGDRVCAEIYGGPQHATITGTVDGRPVDVKVDRTNGCGIDQWQSLEWLLGPPER